MTRIDMGLRESSSELFRVEVGSDIWNKAAGVKVKMNVTEMNVFQDISAILHRILHL